MTETETIARFDVADVFRSFRRDMDGTHYELARFEQDGVTYLSDRFIMLPADLIEVSRPDLTHITDVTPPPVIAPDSDRPSEWLLVADDVRRLHDCGIEIRHGDEGKPQPLYLNGVKVGCMMPLTPGKVVPVTPGFEVSKGIFLTEVDRVWRLAEMMPDIWEPSSWELAALAIRATEQVPA